MIRIVCRDYAENVNLKETFNNVEVVSFIDGKIIGFSFVHETASIGVVMGYAEMVELRDKIDEALRKHNASIHKP